MLFQSTPRASLSWSSASPGSLPSVRRRRLRIGGQQEVRTTAAGLPPRLPLTVTTMSFEVKLPRCAHFHLLIPIAGCTGSGVAFHHAGLDLNDRTGIEGAFLRGDISVICCTSTLAMGVNLPCHLVIIKNTVTWNGAGAAEYSDLEVMQMLGRAGRPQFDTSGVAVIMTRQEKVRHYELMVTGNQLLESRYSSIPSPSGKFADHRQPPSQSH
jgi:hypothetical protein